MLSYDELRAMSRDERKQHALEMSEYTGGVASTVYSPEFMDEPVKLVASKPTCVSLLDWDCCRAATYFDGPVCLLNFASYNNPGGGFMRGSLAQEESICHCSNLYQELARREDYYKWNREHKNRGLYMNRALYSRNVVMGGKHIDVLTCAAPNASVGKKYGAFTFGENSVALDSRINFVLKVALDNKCETLVLGAFGCGVFGQDPWEVARLFRKHIQHTYAMQFENIVFAIPDREGANYMAFKYVLKAGGMLQ